MGSGGCLQFHNPVSNALHVLLPPGGQPGVDLDQSDISEFPQGTIRTRLNASQVTGFANVSYTDLEGGSMRKCKELCLREELNSQATTTSQKMCLAFQVDTQDETQCWGLMVPSTANMASGRAHLRPTDPLDVFSLTVNQDVPASSCVGSISTYQIFGRIHTCDLDVGWEPTEAPNLHVQCCHLLARCNFNRLVDPRTSSPRGIVRGGTSGEYCRLSARTNSTEVCTPRTGDSTLKRSGLNGEQLVGTVAHHPLKDGVVRTMP